jgi:hypothetical protein
VAEQVGQGDGADAADASGAARSSHRGPDWLCHDSANTGTVECWWQSRYSEGWSGDPGIAGRRGRVVRIPVVSGGSAGAGRPERAARAGDRN